MSDLGMARRRRRRLSPSEKYEIYVGLLTGDSTQREAAEKYGVDRSTVVHAVRTAKQGALAALASSVPGRPGQSAEAAAATFSALQSGIGQRRRAQHAAQ